jgi:class 3 adenylate cyclase
VARHRLPSGTVTFLFTDIEGSTRLLNELGEQYADVLAEHRRALREAFERHGGVEVDTAVALARGEPAVATQLLGSTGRLRAEVGSPEGYYKIGDETRKQTLETARQLLGEPAFATVLAEGESLSLEKLTDAAALVV